MKHRNDQPERESALLFEEYRQHVATWPHVQAEAGELQKDCFEASEALRIAQQSGTPFPQIQSLQREQRHAFQNAQRPARNFQVKKGDLERRLQVFTTPEITAFINWSQAKLTNAPQILRRLESRSTFGGSSYVTIQSNSARLESFTGAVDAARARIRGLQNCALADLRRAIKEQKEILENFDFDQTETMETHSFHLQSTQGETLRTESGIIGPSGPLRLGLSASERLHERIEKAQKGL
ncbi:MAG: hypothetical protein FJW35_14135 [Acidobacteria bacterium]|nr:hypothetical protein [Acidobacteriota bacterium]